MHASMEEMQEADMLEAAPEEESYRGAAEVNDSEEEWPSDMDAEEVFRRRIRNIQQRGKPVGGRASTDDQEDNHRHLRDPMEDEDSMDDSGKRHQKKPVRGGALTDESDDEDMDEIVETAHVSEEDKRNKMMRSEDTMETTDIEVKASQRDPAILMRKFKDPEACLQYEVDTGFDDPVQDNSDAIPTRIDRVLPALSSLGVPSINPTEVSEPLEILEFIDRLREYQNLDKARLNILMKYAFRGSLGQKWYHRFGGDYELMVNKLLNWMMHSQEWLDLNAKLVRGERFSSDMETHIRNFKLVAKYMGLRAESDVTKRCFIRSVGPKVITPMLVRKKDMSFKSLQTIMRMALDNQEMFTNQEEAPERPIVAVIKSDVHAGVNASDEEEEADTAAMKERRKRRRTQDRMHQEPEQATYDGVCFVCGKPGHYARDCWFRKGKEPYQGLFMPHQDPSRRMEDEICPVGRGAITRKCEVGGEQLLAMLDTGASINVITKRAAAKVKGERIPVHRSARCVNRQVDIREALVTNLNIGGVHADIRLYLVEEAPADVLLGTPFLIKFSKGFREMLKEFPTTGAEHPEAKERRAAIERQVLEKVVDEHPKLVLSDNQVPDSAGGNGAQNLPHPAPIGKFREILEPLIKAGVYIESDSIMLVPKKKSGEFRLEVDNSRRGHGTAGVFHPGSFDNSCATQRPTKVEQQDISVEPQSHTSVGKDQFGFAAVLTQGREGQPPSRDRS